MFKWVLIYTMKEVNWFNLVYLIHSTTTKLIFCFVTTLASLHFFSCIVTMFPYFLFFFSKNTKNKAIRKHKLPSNSTNNLKPKKPWDQSSIKAFYKGFPAKKGKLNLQKRVSWITSTVANKYAAVRSFGSSSVVGCSEKSIVITKSFESYSELVSSSLKMKVLEKKFLVMN